jgi:HSP20 family protein
MIPNLQRSNEATQNISSLPGWSALPWPTAQEDPLAAAVWGPLVDISESQEEYVIRAELPGIKKGAVKVIADENTLTITGEREPDKAATINQRLRTERVSGSFGRRFSLPNDVNPAKLATDLVDGVLTVRLAKKPKNDPQQPAVADEITAWWQKALGTNSVLGQASNRPANEPAPATG